MKLTDKQIREQADQLKIILQTAVGNAQTSYCIRENIQRLASVHSTWLESIKGDPLASRWLDHIQHGDNQETAMDSLKEASIRFREFENLDLDFEPYIISIENIPGFLKNPIMNGQLIDHWEDDPAATDNLVRVLRIIGALEA